MQEKRSGFFVDRSRGGGGGGGGHRLMSALCRDADCACQFGLMGVSCVLSLCPSPRHSNGVRIQSPQFSSIAFMGSLRDGSFVVTDTVLRPSDKEVTI